ncbi:hypothetical protein DL95DRAFT_407444 [Leptodontidium sp. 2 PMI_412]|nr:hypothetical protein DL95DRAFT_407444 [Leptodontidium sp. 2 PMI_412]
MPTTKRNAKDGKSILMHLPIELRYIIYSEMVKNRTIYMGKVERFSNRNDITRTQNSRNAPCYPIQQFHRAKCPLLAVEHINPAFVAEIQKWLRGVPWVRFFSWGGYFDPSTAVFESPSGENADWQSADEENARREQEWKREKRRLRVEEKTHMGAATMEKSRDHVRLHMDYIKGQRLKGRWQVGSAR